MTFSIDSTSVLVSWHAPDEYSNGLLRQYYIEIADDSLSQMSSYISDNTHLLLDGLQPGHQYTFRVAAYTTEKGPFSQPSSITLPSLQGIQYYTPGMQSHIILSNGEEACMGSYYCSWSVSMNCSSYKIIYNKQSNNIIAEETSQNSSIVNPSVISTETSSIRINIQHHNQVPLMVTSSLLGLVSLLLLVVAIIAGIYISYRLYYGKRDNCKLKNVTRYRFPIL